MGYTACKQPTKCCRLFCTETSGHFVPKHPPPNSESRSNKFQVNQACGVQTKALRQCKSMKLLKEPILLQFLAEPDQSSTVY